MKLLSMVPLCDQAAYPSDFDPFGSIDWNRFCTRPKNSHPLLIKRCMQRRFPTTYPIC